MLLMVLLPTTSHTTTTSTYGIATYYLLPTTGHTYGLPVLQLVYVRECYGTCTYSTNGIATVRRYLYVLYLRYACTYCYAHTYILTHPYLHIATLPIGIHSTCFHILYARYCYGTYFYVLCLRTLQRRYEATYVRMYFNVCILCMYSTYVHPYIL